MRDRKERVAHRSKKKDSRNSENTLKNSTNHGSTSEDRSLGEQLPSIPSTRNYASSILRGNIYHLSKLWMRLLSAIASVIFLGVISVVVGLGTWAPPPVIDLVQRYPTASIIIVGIFVFISFLAWIVAGGSEPQDNNAPPNRILSYNPQRLVVATITSTTSFILCLTLLGVVLIRPPWCPNLLCPAPKLILSPTGVHDNNLELIFHTIQSSSYLIPGDPANYTLDDLPTGTSAWRIDVHNQNPYQVIVGIHSLQQGRFGLIIEQVILILKQITLVPYPLHVWIESETRNYATNLYQVYYGGQEVGARLLAIYTPLNGASSGFVQLIPGESDELDIQVMSRIVADLHFQVQIKYRVVNESQEHFIALPNSFEVIFSNVLDWFPYHLHNGRLVAGS